MRFSSLFLFMVVARVLPADQLGLFSGAMVILTFFGLLAEQGLSEAVVQRNEVSPEQMNAVFWLNLGTSLIIVMLVWLSAEWIAALMKMPELAWILRISSLTMPISASSFGQTAMRRRTFGYRWIATTNMASSIIGIAVALILLFTGFGVWSLVAQTLIGAVVVALLMWVKPAWKLTRQIDFSSTCPLMSYGSYRLGTYLLDFGNTRYIEIFLAYTLGPAALAIYTVGLKLYQALMQLLSSTILDVAHSGFSRLAHDRPALINAYYKSISVTATVAVPVFCLVAAVAPSLTVVLFGSKWAESADVMRWMSILGAVQVLQFYNGTVYNAIGRPSIGLQFMVVKVVLTFGALACVRDSDMNALLLAYILSQLATTPMSFYLVRRLIGVSLRGLMRRIWPMLVGSGLLIASAMAIEAELLSLQYPSLVVVALSCIAGALVYLLVLRLTAPHVLRDLVGLLRPRQVAPLVVAPEQPGDVLTK